MKRKIIILFIVIVAIGIGTIRILQYKEDKNYKKRGEFLISKIEEYHKQKGQLPNSLSDIEIAEEMGEGPYYEKKDSLHYIIYFNIGFDNTKIYCSKTKEWREKP
ncbi:MAG: hypothetical protein J6X32_09845 [Salinivirgaceae bacterium]|nr:hypothetical protein [Salinivirgaceae bacterium]